LRNYPVNPQSIGDPLRRRRIDLGLSVSQLARLLGFDLSNGAIENWERNENRPSEPYRRKLVNFLGFDPELDNQQEVSDVNVVGMEVTEIRIQN
jgi:transcriptional regulator with XRE-family HTH domain